MTIEQQQIYRGDVYFADLGQKQSDRDSIQRGKRPVLVVSNNKANKYSQAITVVPLTTRNKKHLPTHTEFDLPEKDYFVRNTALCEQVRTINIDQLYFKIDSVSADVMARINACLRVALEV